MRLDVVDPAAYTPPYDHALCSALAAAGLDVELVTAPFRHGDVPRASGYATREAFGSARTHPLRMGRYRHSVAADVVHFQWLPLQELDGLLLPRRRPLVLTAHDVLPREPRRFQRAAQRRLHGRMDGIVVHSEHGRRRLVEEAGAAPERIRVIPHGVLDHLASVSPQLPRELPADGPPVVLLFGLLRPYKGLDVLLDAWRGVEAEAELWVVGNPRMALPPLPARTRTVLRFVTDAEAAAVLRRAALVVLPYRQIDQSGVLYAALALGRPLLLSDAGGFPEVGCAEHVPAGDADALRAALGRLLGDPAALAALAGASEEAAATTYAWPAIAAAHARLYAELLA